jgi:hypothetical protein
MTLFPRSFRTSAKGDNFSPAYLRINEHGKPNPRVSCLPSTRPASSFLDNSWTDHFDSGTIPTLVVPIVETVRQLTRYRAFKDTGVISWSPSLCMDPFALLNPPDQHLASAVSSPFSLRLVHPLLSRFFEDILHPTTTDSRSWIIVSLFESPSLASRSRSLASYHRRQTSKRCHHSRSPPLYSRPELPTPRREERSRTGRQGERLPREMDQGKARRVLTYFSRDASSRTNVAS